MCAPSVVSLTIEEFDDDDLRHTHASKARVPLVSHSCVVGLRARLKPERFWFDSRGWDVFRVGSKTGLQLVLTQSSRRFESDPAHVTSHRTQPALPTVTHKIGAGPAAPPSRSFVATDLCATQIAMGATPMTGSIVRPCRTTVVQRSRKPSRGSSTLLGGSVVTWRA